jgi:hypothetical protein
MSADALRAGVRRVLRAQIDEVETSLRDAGWLILRIPCGARDKDSFLAKLRECVPLDPPMPEPRNNWDALRDSLWNGLCSLSNPCIAIVWSDARTMQCASPRDFGVAASILAETAQGLADSTVTHLPAKRVAVILGGDWPPSDHDDLPQAGGR